MGFLGKIKGLDILTKPKASIDQKNMIGGIFTLSLLPCAVIGYMFYLIYQTVLAPDSITEYNVNDS